MTIVSNWIPGEDPAAGPNYYTFSPSAKYNIHIDRNGDALYVGKARNLKNRVSTYFSGSKAHGGRTMAMVSQIASIEVTATASETSSSAAESAGRSIGHRSA